MIANDLRDGATSPITLPNLDKPFNFMSEHFIAHRHAYYAHLREQMPVARAKVSVLNVYTLARYDDCVALLKDPRFVRNRKNFGARGLMPFPTPKSVQLVAKSMILEDEPEHRRLRQLVHRAFTPRALKHLEERIESLTHELLDAAAAEARAGGGVIDLMQAYALPIPVTVIREMVGVSEEDMPRFQSGLRVLIDGFSGLGILRTFLFDLPKATTFLRGLIADKRANPGDDILTGLIQAEEDGERLSEDELISMVYLLIFAGYETTVHLITNGVLTLLQHPQELARLRADPGMMTSAVEEITRYAGPILGTKMNYASEDVSWHGVTIPKGAAVMPLLESANYDPDHFPEPERFDIARSPNRHLGFGQGIHYCLGAPLARLEAGIAFQNLWDRFPDLTLAVALEAIEVARMPLWYRHKTLPVRLEGAS